MAPNNVAKGVFAMTSILESLNDPHARHAMMVHLPIAGSLLGLGLVVLLAAFRFNR